jgi:hypothetical protein
MFSLKVCLEFYMKDTRTSCVELIGMQTMMKNINLFSLRIAGTPPQYSQTELLDPNLRFKGEVARQSLKTNPTYESRG